MAARAAAAAAQVRDRRFKPIYDAIDDGNYKAAVRMTAKRELASHALAKALRAYALQRSGYWGEAEALADEVAAGRPSDEATLSALTSTYRLRPEPKHGPGAVRPAARPSKVTRLYVAAAAAKPDDAELAVEVFQCHVRDGDWSAAKSVAAKLYKLAQAGKLPAGAGGASPGGGEFMVWVAVAIAMDAEASLTGPAAAAAAQKFGLANMMLSKALTAASKELEAVDGSPDRPEHFGVLNSESVLLLVHLLRRQGKFDEALAVLHGRLNRLVRREPGAEGGAEAAGGAGGSDEAEEEQKKGPDGEPLSPSPGRMQLVEMLREEVNLHVDKRDFTRAHATYRRLLAEFDADDWAYHVGLVHTMLLCVGDGDVGDGDSALEDAFAALALSDAVTDERNATIGASAVRGFLKALQRAHGDAASRAPRGPFLAEILLAARLAERATPEASAAAVSSFTDAVIAYIARFGHKAACISDLAPFLRPFARVEAAAPDDADARIASVRVSTPFAPMPKGQGPLRFAFCATDECRERLRAAVASAVDDNDPSTDDLAALSAQLDAAEAAASAAQRDAPAAADLGDAGAAPAPAAALPVDVKANLKKHQDGLRRFITALQVQRVIGEHAVDTIGGAAGEKALVTRLMKLWGATGVLARGNEGGQREVQHRDDLALLAAWICRDAAVRHFRSTDASGTGGAGGGGADAADTPVPDEASQLAARQLLLEAVVILEDARKASPFNFQFRLLLIELYSCLGAHKPSQVLFNALDVKNIQYESLGYLALREAVRFGVAVPVAQAARDVCHAHDDDRRESGEAIALALRLRNTSVAFDVVALREKLRNSHLLAQARSELCTSLMINHSRSQTEAQGFLRNIILEGADDDAAFEATTSDTAALVMNEDLDVFVRWDTPGAATALYEDGKPGCDARFAASRSWLQVRVLAPRVLLWLVEGKVDSVTDKASQLRAALEALGLLVPADAAARRKFSAFPPFDATSHAWVGLSQGSAAVQRAGWAAAMDIVDAAAAVLAAAGGDAAAWERATPLVTSGCAALASAVSTLEESVTYSGDRSQDVRPGFLVDAAAVLTGPVPVASIAIGELAKRLPKLKKAKKGKRGAGSAAAGPGTATAAAVKAGVNEAAKAFTALARAMDAACGKSRAKVDDAAVGFDVDACYAEHTASSEATASRAAAFSRVREAHADNLDALVSLAKDWGGFLRSTKV